MTLSIKKKATDYERALVNRFWEHGFAVMRAPSSSGTPMIPLPDIFAGSVEKGLFFAIELKTSKQEFFYVKKSQIEGLEEFAKRIGAYPILGVKFIGKRMDFLFLPVPDALTPSGGESYKVDINETIHKGIDFEILIKPETWEKKD